MHAWTWALRLMASNTSTSSTTWRQMRCSREWNRFPNLPSLATALCFLARASCFVPLVCFGIFPRDIHVHRVCIASYLTRRACLHASAGRGTAHSCQKFSTPSLAGVLAGVSMACMGGFQHGESSTQAQAGSVVSKAAQRFATYDVCVACRMDALCGKPQVCTHTG